MLRTLNADSNTQPQATLYPSNPYSSVQSPSANGGDRPAESPTRGNDLKRGEIFLALFRALFHCCRPALSQPCNAISRQTWRKLMARRNSLLTLASYFAKQAISSRFTRHLECVSRATLSYARVRCRSESIRYHLVFSDTPGSCGGAIKIMNYRRTRAGPVRPRLSGSRGTRQCIIRVN
jgi:hypothetical protein